MIDQGQINRVVKDVTEAFIGHRAWLTNTKANGEWLDECSRAQDRFRTLIREVERLAAERGQSKGGEDA